MCFTLYSVAGGIEKKNPIIPYLFPDFVYFCIYNTHISNKYVFHGLFITHADMNIYIFFSRTLKCIQRHRANRD